MAFCAQEKIMNHKLTYFIAFSIKRKMQEVLKKNWVSFCFDIIDMQLFFMFPLSSLLYLNLWYQLLQPKKIIKKIYGIIKCDIRIKYLSKIFLLRRCYISFNLRFFFRMIKNEKSFSCA